MRSLVFAFLCLACALAHGAERLDVTVTHELDAARPAETIAIPWAAVASALPGALLQKLEVKDNAGHVLPYQVTNVAPLAHDPSGTGIAYGELLFQHDFVKGEKSARFTIEKSEQVAPVFPTRAFARHVPERLDDFAWENDRIAHRIYGPALAAPAAPGSDKEVLVSSGIDVWFKRVPYPVIDRWYNKGHDHYHKDEGEGLDMYGVGATRGLGGTGIWDGRQLHAGRNYARWKILANGPIRVVFEVSYDTWNAGSVEAPEVSEVKHVTLDAGWQFSRIESTFSFAAGSELTAAIGLNRNPANRDQEAAMQFAALADEGAMLQWFTQKSNGDFGTAVILLDKQAPAFAEDESNQLLLAKVRPNVPLHYLIGAAWNRATDIRTLQDWRSFVAATAARERSPVKVNWSFATEKNNRNSP
jgi:hypothetical protein